MAAYVLIDQLSVTDPAALSAYQLLAPDAVTNFGGRYVLPFDTPVEALEGNWRPHRIVVIEFPDTERARDWWGSAEYAEARALHHAATISNVVMVGGTPNCRDTTPCGRARASEPVDVPDSTPDGPNWSGQQRSM